MSDSQHSESQEEPQEEPHIIVDSDWKEQVAKEKQAAAEGKTENASPESDAASSEQTRQATSESTASAEASSPHSDAGAAEAGQGGTEETLPPPPQASFEVLVSMLFTQAMATLGHIPDPTSGKPTVNKPFAKHYIDTLEMLSEKTRGNLSDDETKMLSEALHALRMAYVSAKPTES